MTQGAYDDPAVQVGQVWADNDQRNEGRTLRIVAVDSTHATVEQVTNTHEVQRLINGGHFTYADRRGKRTRIRLDRFRPTSTGYRLVTEAGEQS